MGRAMYRKTVIGPFTTGVSVQIKRLLGLETAGQRINPRDAGSVSFDAPDLRGSKGQNSTSSSSISSFSSCAYAIHSCIAGHAKIWSQ